MKDYEDDLEPLGADPGQPAEGVGINVKRLLKLRYKMMIIIFLVLAIPLTIAAWLIVPKMFVASGQIEFNNVQTTILDADGNQLTGNAYENYVNTQANLITGWPILSQVVKEPAVQDLPFAQAPDPVQFLFNRVEATLEDDSELVSITYRDEQRDDALTVMNTILDQYRDYVSEQLLKRGELRRSVLEDQAEEIRTDMQRLQEEITELRKEAGLPIGETAGAEPTETESYRVNLAQAEADYTSAQTQLRQTENRLERLQTLMNRYQATPATPIYAEGVETLVSNHPQVALLLEQLSQAQQEYASAIEQYREGRPEITSAENRLQALRERVELVKADARQEALQTVVSEADFELDLRQANVDDAEQRRNQFQELLAANRAENLERSRELVEIGEMEGQREELAENLRNIQASLLELQIESNAPARANILGEATAPTEPDSSDKIKFALLAIVASGAVAAFAGVVREFLDQNIRSAEDLSYITNQPIIAVVPHTDEDSHASHAYPGRVTEESPRSMVADEFRQIMSRVVASGYRGHPLKSIVVTSPSRGDGKTTVSANLAILLSQAERRVLLVDLDTRNPSIENNFGLDAGPGLAELLSGADLDHDPDRATDYQNLFVMGPGLAAADLIDYLASQEMNDFLAGAEEIFDHIIIDTPATLLTSESRLITNLSDAVVLVTGAGVSTFGMVRRALRGLEQSRARVLGVVLNGARHAPGGYLRENMTKYYSHTERRTHRAPVNTVRADQDEPSIVLVGGDNRRDD